MGRDKRFGLVVTIDDFIGKLEGVRRHGQWWSARCPAHDDRHSSLSVSPGASVPILAYCHAGCTLEDILAAMHLEVADLCEKSNDGVFVLDTYTYTDRNGKVLYAVDRRVGKDFRQRHFDGVQWHPNMTGVTRVLYRLPDVIAAVGKRWIILVEGEKDVHSARSLGFTATTWAGGVRSWRAELLGPLKGASVVLIADEDAAGQELLPRQLEDLGRAGAKVRHIRLGHKDLTDWVMAGGTAEAFRTLVQQTTPTGVLARYGADVERKSVNFLWNPRIPQAKLTLLVGDPDQGKSYVSLALAAAITNGAVLPDSTSAPRGTVALLAFEDDAEDTVMPRFDRLGGDEKRIVILSYRNEDGSTRALSPGDLPGIVEALKALPELRLVIIDPIMNLMLGWNENRGGEVRAILTPLVHVAQELQAAVLGLIHMNKADMANVLYRVSGSGAFVQVARSVLLAGTHPETGRRYLTHPKHNLSTQADTIEYVVDENGMFSWGDIAPDVTAEALLERKRPREVTTRAERFLADYLGDGTGRRRSEIEAAAEAAGIPQRTLYRARNKLGVVGVKEGFQAEAYWSLPPLARGNTGNNGKDGKTADPADDFLDFT